MPYTAEIDHTTPTAFRFLVDQPGSMADAAEPAPTKAQYVVDVRNRTPATRITRCTKAEGTRDQLHVDVIGHSDASAQNGMAAALTASVLHPVSAIETGLLPVDDRTRQIDDGAGWLVSATVKVPVRFEARAGGWGPMCEATTTVAETLAAWCDQHPNSSLRRDGVLNDAEFAAQKAGILGDGVTA